MLVSNVSAQLFKDSRFSSSTIFSTGVTESEKLMGGCNFRNILLINEQKCYRKKFHVFLKRNFQFGSEFHSLVPDLHLSLTDFVEVLNTLIQEKHNQNESVSKLRYIEELKKLKFTMQLRNLVTLLLVRTCDTFVEVLLAMNLD